MKISSATCLIVDDDEFTLEIQTRNLHQIGFQHIHQAYNGHEAITLMRRKMIDCVIADFNMPVMNGLEMLKHIRMGEQNLKRNTPVALITGHNDKHLVGTALMLDVNAFILKPVQKITLETRINKIFAEINELEYVVKPIECYEFIDVNMATKEIGKSVKLKTEEIHDNTLDNQINDTLKVHKKKKNIRLTEIIETSSSEKQIDQSNSKYCSLFEVPIGSVLAEDLYDQSGRKMLASGQTITKGLIERIRDINLLGINTGDVFIQS